MWKNKVQKSINNEFSIKKLHFSPIKKKILQKTIKLATCTCTMEDFLYPNTSSTSHSHRFFQLTHKKHTEMKRFLKQE